MSGEANLFTTVLQRIVRTALKQFEDLSDMEGFSPLQPAGF
jgi:hypothetical protein